MPCLSKELDRKFQTLLSGLADSKDPSDTYNLMEAQFERWRGTIQEKLSKNHRNLDLMARHPHTKMTLVQKPVSIRSLNKLQILDYLSSFEQPDIEFCIANSESNLVRS